MAARGAEVGNEAGDEQMDDDWAGALPAAAAGPRDANPEEPKIIKEHGDPHAMAPENGRMPCTLTSPIRPSAEDVAKHYVAHMPPRSWCSICNAANLKEDPHKKVDHEVDDRKTGLPTVSLDYTETQIGKDGDREKRVVKSVVMKDEVSGAVASHRTVRKGPGDEWLMKRLVRDIKEWGRNDIFLKTDGEAAMIAVQSALQRLRERRSVPLNPRRAMGHARRQSRTWESRSAC